MDLPLIYFVRHGQTDWNAEKRLQGQAERDLTPLGKTQATRNGERLKALVGDGSGFDFVASPMLRTRHTMERLRTAMGLDPSAYRTDKRLFELHFGDWQGFTFDELEAKTPGVKAARLADKWGYVPPGALAESYEMLERRVRDWLATVTEPTICVSHGGILRCIFLISGAAGRQQAGDMDILQDRVLRLQDGKPEWL